MTSDWSCCSVKPGRALRLETTPALWALTLAAALWGCRRDGAAWKVAPACQSVLCTLPGDGDSPPTAPLLPSVAPPCREVCGGNMPSAGSGPEVVGCVRCCCCCMTCARIILASAALTTPEGCAPAPPQASEGVPGAEGSRLAGASIGVPRLTAPLMPAKPSWELVGSDGPVGT